MKSAAAFMIILLTAVEVAEVTSGCIEAGVTGVTLALSLGGVIIMLLNANAATVASCCVGCTCIAISLSIELAMVT